jgi:subtilase family serine protease
METWSDNYTLGLAPGEVAELSANNGQGGIATWQAVSGVHRITAHVDDIGRIDESDRDNNQLAKILKVE